MKAIGVFDSGVGGLTVLRALALRFPNENFIYLGDTARLPYGNKSPETIQKYSEQNINYLYKKGVKAIIIACNSASSHCTLDMYHGIPIYSVIMPGARSALEKSKSGTIGVLGTRATVNSESYVNAIHRLSPTIKVIQQICPLFVPLAEEGLIEDAVTEIIAQRYLASLLSTSKIDTIILGCTHYPILKPTLEKLTAANPIQWIDSGEAMADLLENEFSHGHLIPNLDLKKALTQGPQIRICITDSSEQFFKMAQKILEPLPIHEFETVSLVEF